MSIIIAGIHTGIGKTVCSAIICQALGYDYWKPVQAGMEDTDSNFIKVHVTNPACQVHKEKYCLKTPASPHYAAAMENVTIKKEDIVLPLSLNNIVVETAGGLMSPLAKDFLNIDLTAQLQLPVILVSSDYLGSINHTLLSHAALAGKKIPIKGIVFSGNETNSSREYILDHTKLPLLFSIPAFDSIDATTIAQFANTIDINL